MIPRAFPAPAFLRWKARRPPALAMGAALAAGLLMSSYVHVLQRAVDDAPRKQQAAFAAAALHDTEADRATISRALPPGPVMPTATRTVFATSSDTAGGMARNRLFDRFEAAKPSAKAHSI